MTFQNLSEIFTLHITHIMIYILRLKSIDNNKCLNCYQNYKYFRYCFCETTFHWVILICLLCMPLHISLFEPYITIWEKMLGISNYDIYVWTPIIGYLAIEQIWFDSFKKFITNNYKMIQILNEMKKYYDHEFNLGKKLELIKFYSSLLYLKKINFNLCVCCLIYLASRLIVLSILRCLESTISLIQLIIYILLSIGMNNVH